MDGTPGVVALRQIMKPNENRNQQTNENRSEESNGDISKAAMIDRWWENQTQDEKEFAFELGKMVLGLKENEFTDITTGTEKVKEKLRVLLQRLDAAYDNAGVQLSGGALDRWRWN